MLLRACDEVQRGWTGLRLRLVREKIATAFEGESVRRDTQVAEHPKDFFIALFHAIRGAGGTIIEEGSSVNRFDVQVGGDE